MILVTLWIRRVGEDSPELLVAWDEYSVDSNSDGFQEECERALRALGREVEAQRHINIIVPSGEIDEAFGDAWVRGHVDSSKDSPAND